jgi:hypothetical protein
MLPDRTAEVSGLAGGGDPAGRVGLVTRIVGDGFIVEPNEPVP